MKPLECIDFNCPGKDAIGRCSTFWLCLVRLADHLAYLSMVVLGCFFFLAVGLIVHANHTDPASMTLVSTLTGIFGGILYAIRQRIDRVEDKKQVREVAEKLETKTEDIRFALETKTEEAKNIVSDKIAAIDQKLDPIKTDVKAAVVAAKVGVQQNVVLLAATKEITTNVNGGKEKEKQEAYQQGREDQKAEHDSKF